MRAGLKTETKVGLFVIIGVVILAVATSMVGKFRWGKPEGQEVTAVFGSVSGLEEKAPVRIAGVRVGEVEKIYLKDGLAYVVMRLEEGAVLREDSEVTISSEGLLGEKYVEITSGTPGSPVVKPGETLHGRDVVSMDKLIDEFTEIAKDIKGITAGLRSFLGTEGEASPVRGMLDDFSRMSRDISELVRENREGIKGAVSSFRDFADKARGTLTDNEADIRAAVQNFRQLSENLNRQLDDLGGKLDKLTGEVSGTVESARQDFASSMKEVEAAAAKIGQTVDSLKEVVERARKGEGTVGKLLTDETAYNNLNRALDSIAGLSDKIQKGEGTLGKLVTSEEAYNSFKDAFESINRYVKRGEETKLYVGFRSEYLLDSQDTKSYFSLRINPREDKFYLLEAVDDPRGSLSITDTFTTTTVGGQETSVHVHEDRYEDELKFSFQFGRRWDDFALRGGLMESTGGVGADWYFDKNRGRASVDFWDFDREEANPHLKAGVSYNVFKDVFLSAGVDDFIEPDNVSFYLGAGLTFSDDDLKYLLSLTGGVR